MIAAVNTSTNEETKPHLGDNIADAVEEHLVSAFLNGTYLVGAALPGERDLAAQLGITRPTLREVLKRLERDGWIKVRHGKPTLISDIYRDGGLNALSTIVRRTETLPPDFIPNLLAVRLDLAPAYTRQAITRGSKPLLALLETHPRLEDSPEQFARYDWLLHRELCITSGNPIYTMILNGFAGFYERMARVYFSDPQARKLSKNFYAVLLSTLQSGDALTAEAVTRSMMRESIRIWESLNARSKG